MILGKLSGICCGDTSQASIVSIKVAVAALNLAHSLLLVSSKHNKSSVNGKLTLLHLVFN